MLSFRENIKKIIIFICCLNLEEAFALEKTPILNCKPKDARNFDDLGQMPADTESKNWLYKHWEFSINLDNGYVWLKSDIEKISRGVRYTIVQEGGETWDTILFNKDSGNVIRIRDWKSLPHVVYIWVELNQIVTGTCSKS